jgi:hypothetical protein
MWRVTAKARFVQQLDTSALETAMSTLGTVSAARCARRDRTARPSKPVLPKRVRDRAGLRIDRSRASSSEGSEPLIKPCRGFD